MSIRVVRLGTPRARGEGPRLGTVRLDPRTWKLLEEAETANTFADGIVYCWPAGPSLVEPDALLVALPT